MRVSNILTYQVSKVYGHVIRLNHKTKSNENMKPYNHGYKKLYHMQSNPHFEWRFNKIYIVLSEKSISM